MALSDLELLQLAEAAKEKQKGPKGDPGVGIDRVEQFDNSSFTLRLTDGSFKKIELQPGQDGPVGPIGIQGERGEPGPAGRPGNDGAAGTDGKDGLPGRDGSYVDTAVVNGNGHLLLGLSDGQVIDVGRVVGPVGATGERGATGLPGEPGVDGAAVLSGPRAPQESDGEEGDHWIDISSAEFCFYKKSGNGWVKLANLRQPAQDRLIGAGVGGGNGNGGGSGGGTLQNTRTLPLVNPSIPDGLETQEDYNVFVYDALSNLGQGEGGIETFPWIRIYMFQSEPSTNWFYQTSWETNTNATYTWQWEVDANDTGDFIDIADHPQKTELGFDGREYSNGLFLNKIGQESTFPNAKIRERITSQINTSPVNELSTPIMQMWELFEDVIDEPLYSKGESGGGGNITFATKQDVDVVEVRVAALEQAVFPYVEFLDENRSCSYKAGGGNLASSVRMYQYWNSSPTGQWMWAWMIKFPGSEQWTDVDDLSQSEQASIGYNGTEEAVYLFLYPSDPNDMPDIEVRLKVTDSLEGFETAEEWSEPFFPREKWVNKDTNPLAVATSVRPRKQGRGKLNLLQP